MRCGTSSGFSSMSLKYIRILASNSPQPDSDTSKGGCLTTERREGERGREEREGGREVRERRGKK